MTPPPDHPDTENAPGSSVVASAKSEGRVPPSDESTGLPGLRTWRSVYVFVLGVFLVWVGLLTALTKLYS